MTALYAFNQIWHKPVLKAFCLLCITQGTLIFQNTRPGVNKSPVSGRQGEKKIVLWCLIFVGIQYDTCFVSTFWGPEFCDGS